MRVVDSNLQAVSVVDYTLVLGPVGQAQAQAQAHQVVKQNP